MFYYYCAAQEWKCGQASQRLHGLWHEDHFRPCRRDWVTVKEFALKGLGFKDILPEEGYIGIIWGVYRDHGKVNGSYYLGFRVTILRTPSYLLYTHNVLI